jgi:hypothetical protein
LLHRLYRLLRAVGRLRVVGAIDVEGPARIAHHVDSPGDGAVLPVLIPSDPVGREEVVSPSRLVCVSPGSHRNRS